MKNIIGKNIILTGITGFLGSYIAKSLLEQNNRIFAFARPDQELSARQRVLKTIESVIGEKLRDIDVDSKLIVLDANICLKNCGLSQENIDLLKKANINIIFHCAALTDFKKTAEEFYCTNIEGTRNIFELVTRLSNDGSQIKFCHMSTIYIAGNHQGKFNEQDFYLGQKFNNLYEETKFKSEEFIRENIHNGANASIFRIGLIAGESSTGKINTFKHIYQPLRLLSQGLFNILPANYDGVLNIVSVDIAAAAILNLSTLKECSTYQIISPKIISVQMLLEAAGKYFKFNIPTCIPSKIFNWQVLSTAQRYLIEPFVPYLNCETQFDAHATETKLRNYNFEYPNITIEQLNQYFKYCELVGYIKKNE